jgi:hypothetical protein
VSRLSPVRIGDLKGERCHRVQVDEPREELSNSNVLAGSLIRSYQSGVPLDQHETCDPDRYQGKLKARVNEGNDRMKENE